MEAMLRAASATGHPVTVRLASVDDTPPATSLREPAKQPEEVSSEITERASHGIALGLSGVSAIPIAGRTTLEWIAQGDIAIGRSAGTILIVTMIAAFLALIVRKMLPGKRSFEHSLDLRTRTGSASRSALAHLVALGLFVLISFTANRGLLSLTIPAEEAYTALVRVVAVIGVHIVVGDWLLSPRRSRGRLLSIKSPGWHFWMLVAYGAAGSIILATVALFEAADVSPAAIQGVSFLGASLVLLLKVIWFSIGRHDIAEAFAGQSPGAIRRAASHAYPWFLMTLAIILWLMSCLVIAGSPVNDWNSTARLTQLLAFLVPLVAIGFHALAASFLDWHKSDNRPVVAASYVAGRTLVTGMIWLSGIFIGATLWGNALAENGPNSLSVHLDSTLRIGLGVVAGWSLWTFASTFFRIHLPDLGTTAPGPGDEEIKSVPATRLSTVLPLIRDVALGLVVAVTALLLLSTLGLDISPLLAGFGVFGLAVSFGSQALVKDIVSGIFFIAEDAFRVGEYIDTGRLKGTVEHISLRSVRLRHQNGQFHTMPFGQIQSITNYSRDWSVVKFELRFDLGVDVEKLRQTVKRVGLNIMEDPELAAQILQPLKMLGIQDVTETALVVRFKFTARPGNPSLVQRDAIKRLLVAFREDGLNLASGFSLNGFRPLASAALS